MTGMSLRTQARLWYWQRMSAMVLALCVFVHIGIVIYAVRGGLSASQILGRTRGNVPMGLFYAAFVVACAVHVPIGLLRIAEEWLKRRAWYPLAALAAAVLLLVMGLRALYGMFL